MDSIDFTYLHLKYGINDYNDGTLRELCRGLGPRITIKWILDEYDRWLKETPITKFVDDVATRSLAKIYARKLRSIKQWPTKVWSMERLLSIVSNVHTKNNLYILLEKNVGKG